MITQVTNTDFEAIVLANCQSFVNKKPRKALNTNDSHYHTIVYSISFCGSTQTKKSRRKHYAQLDH